MKIETTDNTAAMWQPNFFQHRWPEVRTWNLKQVKKLWDEDPNRVQVINDPRLESTSLVMMRKDQFERMKNIISDLLDGQAGVDSDLRMAFEQVSLIEKTVLPSGDTESIQRAFSVLKGIVKRSSKIFVAEPKAIPHPPPTEEELSSYTEGEDL